MKKRLYIFLFCLACAICAHAETLLLRTGARVKGSIVFQNEEVVIIRDKDGARFQYPKADIEQVLADEAPKTEEQKSDQIEQTEEITTPKKASILLELAGGVAVLPNDAAGGAVSADLLVGSHHIGDRHLFIGGGLGYHGLFLGGEKYNFLPIQIALRMPFIEAKHAPVFGAAIGYGIALSKNYLGGIYSGIDFGYRCQINPKTAISIVGFAQLQQAKIEATEIIEGTEFINRTGRVFFTPGLKLALYF